MEERTVGVSLEALKEIGESKKSRVHFFVACEVGVGEPFNKSSTRRFAVLGRFATLGGNRIGSIGVNDTEGNFSSSRTSLMVKEA